jgi:hypothetical protein
MYSLLEKPTMKFREQLKKCKHHFTKFNFESLLKNHPSLKLKMEKYARKVKRVLH